MDLGRAEDYEQAVNEFEQRKSQILGDGFVYSEAGLLNQFTTVSTLRTPGRRDRNV
jgi:hypothetical protein